jgi:hypothetical protein
LRDGSQSAVRSQSGNSGLYTSDPCSQVRHLSARLW